MDEWYLKSDGNEVGPFDLATMHRMVATKAIKADTLARIGNGPWAIAASFPELGTVQFDRRQPPPPIPINWQPVAKWTVIVVATIGSILGLTAIVVMFTSLEPGRSVFRPLVMAGMIFGLMVALPIAAYYKLFVQPQDSPRRFDRQYKAKIAVIILAAVGSLPIAYNLLFVIAAVFFMNGEALLYHLTCLVAFAVILVGIPLAIYHDRFIKPGKSPVQSAGEKVERVSELAKRKEP